MGLKFNGTTSDSLKIVVEHPPDRTIPERDYEVIHVPGRSKDVVIDKGSYKNVKREYEIAKGSSKTTFEEVANDISKWLSSAVGYARLEDDYDPDHYRMAVVSGETEIENIFEKAGRATIVFDCAPQRFLVSGDTATTMTSSAYINNPTKFNSLPLIEVKLHKGPVTTVKIGSYQFRIQVTSTSGTTKLAFVESGKSGHTFDSEQAEDTGSNYYLVIDSNIGRIYFKNYSTTSANVTILQSYNFPVLKPGNNYISFSGTVTEVKITPRWWEI